MATLTPARAHPAPSQPPVPRPARGNPTWSTYVGFVRRHALLLVLLPLVGLASGFAWAWQQPHTYSATTDMVVYPVPAYVTEDANTHPESVTIDSDAQLALGTEVRSRVASELGMPASQVRRGLTVSAVPLSSVLHVTFTADTRDGAVRGSTAAAQAFLDVRSEDLVALRDAQVDRLARRLSVIQDRLLAQYAANPALDAEDPVLKLYVTVRDRLHALQDARALPAEVISRAEPPTEPDSIDPEVPLVSGFMVGLLLACVGGTARDVARRGRDLGPASPVNVITPVTGHRQQHLDLPDVVNVVNANGMGGPDEPRARS